MRNLILSLSIIGSLFISACCKPGVQSKWCNVKTAVLDCGSALLRGKLPGLLGDVTKILEGGKADWKSQLDDLSVDGFSVAVCVVREYIKLNSSVTSSDGGVGTSKSALTVNNLSKAPAVFRALEYLRSKQ